jgi:hypothetical protein
MLTRQRLQSKVQNHTKDDCWLEGFKRGKTFLQEDFPTLCANIDRYPRYGWCMYLLRNVSTGIAKLDRFIKMQKMTCIKQTMLSYVKY